MNPNHIVGVWVLSDLEKGAFATGYPIAPNRILTVAHILKANDSQILVRFVYCEGTPIREATICWNGRETDKDGLDALVLECPFPDSVRPSVDLATESPDKVETWFSNCFPEFARDGGVPKEYLDARGKFNPAPDGRTLPLECDEKKPIPVAWGGASGGPVFVGSRRLVGIISGMRLGTASKRSDGVVVAPFERLIAVPVWKLMANTEFVASLGGVSSATLSESEEAWRTRLATQIRIALRGIDEPYALERFEYHYGKSLPDDVMELDRLSRALVDQPELVDTISAIRQDCRKKKCDGAADRLEEVENLLLPRLFPADERKRFWDELRFRGAILVERAVTCPAAADLRMANFDGRETHLVPGSSGTSGDAVTQWQSGAMLRLGEVVPGELSAEHLAFRILLELAGQRLSADHLTLTERAREEILSGHAKQESYDTALADARQLASRLGATLQARKRRYGTPYCVIRVQDTKLQRATLVSALGVLRDWLPELDFLEISHDCPHGHHESPMLALLSSRIAD